MLKSLNGKWLQYTLNVVIFGSTTSTYINKPRYKMKAQIVQWIVAVWSQFMHKHIFVFLDAISHSHIDNKAYEWSNRKLSLQTQDCAPHSKYGWSRITLHPLFLNHKLCRHFQKDIQSQFNDTSLRSHALITHNPLPHPTYGLKTQGSNLSCALS